MSSKLLTDEQVASTKKVIFPSCERPFRCVSNTSQSRKGWTFFVSISMWTANFLWIDEWKEFMGCVAANDPGSVDFHIS